MVLLRERPTSATGAELQDRSYSKFGLSITVLRIFYLSPFGHSCLIPSARYEPYNGGPIGFGIAYGV
jgi:hypothetical protein